MKKFTEEKEKKHKSVKVRIRENLLNKAKETAKSLGLSLGSYVNFMLSQSNKKKVLFEEKINKYEKKEIKSGLYLTKSEAELLKQYAQINDWSISKELRYRLVSTLSKKPKLSKEELKAVYSIRSAINILGTNLNYLIRNNQLISNHHTDICHKLIELIEELINKIDYLEKCSYTHFKLKVIERD